MNFRTKINPKPSTNTIDYRSSILLFGSCFSNHIGAKLDYFKFDVTTNPFGIIFQPKAIENIIEKCVNKSFFTEDDLFFHQERWHCFEIHSSLSSTNKSEMLLQLNQLVEQVYKQITEASHLVITLGTAWAYQLKESKQFVANCHKIPQANFNKELLSISTISESLENIMNQVSKLNANCAVMFTVSPVRHIKDGMVENNLSKAHLISAIHQVVEGAKIANYFPSYELMLDDLRDYRFYKKDMIHPSDLAVDYIWSKFESSWINSTCKNPMKLVDEVQKGIQHRPFNMESEAHQKFLNKLESKKTRLEKEFNITF